MRGGEEDAGLARTGDGDWSQRRTVWVVPGVGGALCFAPAITTDDLASDDVISPGMKTVLTGYGLRAVIKQLILCAPGPARR